jgi:hypothetical protein
MVVALLFLLARSGQVFDSVCPSQVQLPTSMQFDTGGRLWIAGGPLAGDAAGHLCLGVVQPTSVADDRQVLCLAVHPRSKSTHCREGMATLPELVCVAVASSA